MKVGVDVSRHQLEWPELRRRVVSEGLARVEEFATDVMPELVG